MNGEGEKVTARFREGTLARIRAALAKGETQADMMRLSVERELDRRERDTPAKPSEGR